MMEAIAIATVVSTGILLTDSGPTGKNAVNNIALATYKYTELDKIVEPIVKNIEKKYVPEILRDAGVSGYFAYRLVHDKQVAYTWSF
jgi:hypothetical protein